MTSVNDYNELSVACWYGDIEKVKHLLSKGLSYNESDIIDDTAELKDAPLLQACNQKFLQIAEILLKYGMNVDEC